MGTERCYLAFWKCFLYYTRINGRTLISLRKEKESCEACNYADMTYKDEGSQKGSKMII